MKNRNAQTLGGLLRNHIKPGTIIFTDGCGYNNDDNYFSHHFRVNHSEKFVNYKE